MLRPIAPASRAQAQRLFPKGFVFVWTRWQRRAGRWPTDAHAIVAAFDNAASPFLPSYPGQAWPADNVVCMAALRDRFRSWFVVPRLGLPGVREFLPGARGAADEDSGPLLLGVSLSASAVAVAAARANGDARLADALASTADFVGETPARPGERQYLLRLLPIADAFVAWANAVPGPQLDSGGPRPQRALPAPGWRLPAHALSAVAVAPADRGWPRHV